MNFPVTTYRPVLIIYENLLAHVKLGGNTYWEQVKTQIRFCIFKLKGNGEQYFKALKTNSLNKVNQI